MRLLIFLNQASKGYNKSNRPCHGLEAILTRRQPREKLQCLYENIMSNNFSETAVLKKKLNCKLTLHS